MTRLLKWAVVGAVLCAALVALLATMLPVCSRRIAARACVERADALLRTDDYDSAIAQYTQAIALRPNSADTYYRRGTAYDGKGTYDRTTAGSDKAAADFDEAIADLDRAIALKPDCAGYYVNRSASYAEGRHDYDHSIADCDKAISLKPDYANAYCGRAWAWYGKMDYDRAWADVKRCREHGETPDPAFVQKLRKASGRDE